MQALVAQWGDVAALAAKEWFDAQRTRETGQRGQRALMAVTVPADMIASTVRWAAGPLWQGRPEATKARLDTALTGWVKQASRDTIIQNAERDRTARWARIPQGITCAFCLVMASRGFVYRSAKTAGDPRVTGASTFHDHCDCLTVATWDAPKFPDYNPDALYHMYRTAADHASSGDIHAIVAQLRHMYPDQLTDGVQPATTTSGSGGGAKPPTPPKPPEPSVPEPNWSGKQIKPDVKELDALSDFGLTVQRPGAQYTLAKKKAALRSWTGGAYRAINDTLFGKPVTQPKRAVDPWDQIHTIDEALADHPTTTAFTVDRQMHLDTFGVTNVQDALTLPRGKEFDHAGFLATSLNEGGEKANPDPRIATRILVPPGMPAAYLEKITSIAGEEEILLPRGQRLEYVTSGSLPNGQPVLFLRLVP